MKRLVLWMIVGFASAGLAQVPSFINFQGRLLSGTNLVNGSVEMWLRLYTNASGGVHFYEDTGTVAVADGLYSTRIGDGTSYGSFPAVLTNSPLYVEVVVNSTILSPRERLASVAYALTAGGVTNRAISNAMLDDNAVSSAKVADGSLMDGDLNVSANIQGSKLAAGTVSSAQLDVDSFSNVFWKLDGNAGTATGTHFLGTADNRPLEVRANNLRALLIQPTNGCANFMVGNGNVVSNGTHGCSILGGTNNSIASLALKSVVGGGYENSIGLSSIGGVIGGGQRNSSTNAWFFVIAGGSSNSIASYCDNSAILGGSENVIEANAEHAVIAGGGQNLISNNADFSFIAGGYSNVVGTAARYAFAAGRQARASHPGTFVWADSQGGEFASSASNQFLIRAERGVGINTTNPVVDFRVFGQTILGSNTQASVLTSTNVLNLMVGITSNHQINGITFWEQGSFGMSLGYDGRELGNDNKLIIYSDTGAERFIFKNGGYLGIGVADPTNRIHVVGGAQCNGSSWLNASDRNLKENFRAVDPAQVLEKVAGLPISEWNYKIDDPSRRHMGPTAQDFYSTFGLGDNDTTISTVDPSGVALAAIQALVRENAALKRQMEAMRARLEALEKR